ncbi:hypothetical protein VB715_09660 [Crocosphaera sp. UHCC 0190]|uniref:slr1957 family protein n=1 Tax=Crocosphaera sp. UHCC 0190 TaxID=3110246 RepID=UPI002B1FAFB3|nr:hypothetical protein [Crocosphaera sp. UHCC 0190]MEA5510029.1 hypothetical protein [Crocosphaera sp. UHCC 0190]
MKHFCDDWIQEWCEDNGWTDLVREPYNNYWAFPPGAVMPEPIPAEVLRLIKATKGFCEEERAWLLWAVALSVVSVGFTYFFKSPMPIVFAFAFDAIAAAKLEVEEI